MLRGKVRKQAGRAPQPTAGILDSQSVKTDVEGKGRGDDANKKLKGRKRHLVVDTQGLVLVAWMSTADVQDRDATAAIFPLAGSESTFHGPSQVRRRWSRTRPSPSESLSPHGHHH